jgi:HK97 family phage prohead protease
MGAFSFFGQKMPTKADILKSIKSRNGRNGVITADRYFRSIEGCFDGGFCPTKLFSKASSDEWAKELKRAEDLLTFSHDRLRINHKQIKSGSDAGAGLLMSFDCVITTSRQDRDKDFLITAGARLDKNAPLLWQHIPIQPLGPQLSQKSGSEALRGKFGIANTELGWDAAKLVEAKALRISHGFIPDEGEFEANEDDGWTFKAFEIYEVSLVSVPSNVEAVIEAYSRNTLKNEAVRAWGKKEFDARQRQGKGFAIPDLKTGETVSANWLNQVKDAAVLSANAIQKELGFEEKPACSCHSKNHKVVSGENTKQAFGDVTGSYEDLRCRLQDDIARFFAAAGDALDRNDWAYIHSTFPDYCIVCVSEDYDESDYYRISWELVDGKPTLVAEAVEVVLTLTAEAKSRHALLHKTTRRKTLPSIVGGPVPQSDHAPSVEGEGPVGQMTCPECGWVGVQSDFMDDMETTKSFAELKKSLIERAGTESLESIQEIVLSLRGVLDQAEARREDQAWRKTFTELGLE